MKHRLFFGLVIGFVYILSLVWSRLLWVLWKHRFWAIKGEITLHLCALRWSFCVVLSNVKEQSWISVSPSGVLQRTLFPWFKYKSGCFFWNLIPKHYWILLFFLLYLRTCGVNVNPEWSLGQADYRVKLSCECCQRKRVILLIKTRQAHQTGGDCVTFQSGGIQSGDRTDYPCVHLVIH